MPGHRFCLLSGWEVIVEERAEGGWDAFVRDLVSSRSAYLTAGHRVPGGPFPSSTVAGAAGRVYAEEQKSKRLG
jgi:hypothetical protein